MNLNKFVFILPGGLNKATSFYILRHFSQTSKLYSFYERDTRGGDYPLVNDKPLTEILKDGNKAFVEECKKFWHETKEDFHQDRKLYTHGDTDVLFRFDSEDCLKQWRLGSDKINKEGNSECTLTVNDKKKAVFQGNIDLSVPKDGKKRYAGYCSMRSIKKKKSFFRDDFFRLEPFTHIELRVKGDGRNYAVNLGAGMYYDVNWFTLFTYAMFTHGGPYWQTIRIPFSKFFLQSKGRVQDKQCPPLLHKINSIGITCAGVAGPFKLEIDYIGCHCDWTHKEKHAYEMYKFPKEYVSY